MTFDLQHLHISVVTTVVTAFLALLPIAVTVGDLTQDFDFDRKNPFLPSFLPTPSNVTFSRGEEAILQCAIDNRGTRTIVWRRASDPNPLTIGMDTYISDSRFKVVHNKHSLEWNLHITDARPEDSGVYECQVSAKRRHIRQNIMLTVEAAPRRETPELRTTKPEISITGTLFVEKGETLRLVCNATGSEYPPDAIDWFKDGDKIKNDERITLSSDASISDRTIISTLSIRRGHMGDAGTYVCRTSGHLVTSAKVNILNTGTNNEKRESSDVTMTSDHKNRSCQPSACSPLLTALLLLTTAVCLRPASVSS